MSETKDKTGYKTASDVTAKPFNGTIPGPAIPTSADNWARGKLTQMFKAPAELTDVLKGRVAPGALDAQDPRTQQQKQNYNGTQQSARNEQDEKFVAEKNQPRDLKPADAMIAPLRAGGMAAIPARFAPVVAAGVTSSIYKRVSDKKYEDAGPDGYRQGDEFKPYTEAGKRNERRERLEEAQDRAESTSSDINMLQQYYAQEEQRQFNEYVNTMAQYTAGRARELEAEERRLEASIAQRQQRDAELGAELGQIDEKITERTERLGVVQEDIKNINEDITETKAVIGQKTEQAAQNDATLAKTKEEQAKLTQQKTEADQKKALELKTAAEKQDAADAAASDVRMLRSRVAGAAANNTASAKTDLAAAKAKTLKDDQGRAVSKDETGKYYTTDATGKRVDYSAQEQEKLKQAQQAGGLSTADEIKQKEETLKTAEKNEAGTATVAQQTAQQKEQFEAESAQAKQQANAYAQVSESLDKPIKEHTDKIKALIDERKAIEQSLKDYDDKLKTLGKQLEDKLGDEKKIKEDIAELKTLQIQKTQEREANKAAFEEDKNKLETVTQDKENLNKMTAAYNRLKDMPPGPARDKIQKEIADTKANMSAPERTRFEENEKKAEAAMKANSPAAKAVAPAATQTAAAPATTTAQPTANNTSRATGSAAAELASDGQVVAGADKAPTASFNDAAAPGNTPAPAAEPAPEQDVGYTAPKVAKPSNASLNY